MVVRAGESSGNGDGTWAKGEAPPPARRGYVLAMARVHDKVAIVTGAARGIGEACARLLAREGATVYVTDIDDALGASVAASLGGAAATPKRG